MTEAEYIRRAINSGLTILIVSGEYEDETISEYRGDATVRAILGRLRRERCGGNRWARIDVRERVIISDREWAMYRHGCL